MDRNTVAKMILKLAWSVLSDEDWQELLRWAIQVADESCNPQLMFLANETRQIMEAVSNAGEG